MEFKEINVPEGIVQQINHEGSFADITVDVGNGDYLYSNVNLDELHEDTLGGIEKTLGSVPGFMKFLPKEVLVHNWRSWKSLAEMDLERARYLLSTDEMLEEKFVQTVVGC